MGQAEQLIHFKWMIVILLIFPLFLGHFGAQAAQNETVAASSSGSPGSNQTDANNATSTEGNPNVTATTQTPGTDNSDSSTATSVTENYSSSSTISQVETNTATVTEPPVSSTEMNDATTNATNELTSSFDSSTEFTSNTSTTESASTPSISTGSVPDTSSGAPSSAYTESETVLPTEKSSSAGYNGTAVALGVCIPLILVGAACVFFCYRRRLRKCVRSPSRGYHNLDEPSISFNDRENPTYDLEL